ncbi:hypothetical protein [Flagellimonas myxillae]|uniref:hypothetical protein n=1 Tax=Flagellimonas myxillae TaxID=2942214 RepID=UPI00201F2811|nr:hypothetical protein [Muricauda myxillae]MCL6267003.1 hypothetical protein [Muricauda myxillae]
MKTVRFLLVIFACGLASPAWSQVDTHVQGLRFYEQLAQRDASYEWGLHKLEALDEQDYWTDQRNYERHLGKANFPAYLAYMKGKKEAYQQHLEQCDGTCVHSRLFLERAKEYLSLSDAEFMSWSPANNVVQHLPKKKKLK